MDCTGILKTHQLALPPTGGDFQIKSSGCVALSALGTRVAWAVGLWEGGDQRPCSWERGLGLLVKVQMAVRVLATN